VAFQKMSELEKLRKNLKEKRLKACLYFEGVKYVIILNNQTTVEEKTTGLHVKWFQAFGNKTLNDIFKYFKLSKIIISNGKEEKEFKTLIEAINYLLF
jgi:hypothetical protein